MKKLLAFLAVGLLWATAATAQTLGPTTLQSRPAGSGGPTIDDISTYTLGKLNNLALNQFDFLGDSRTANLYVTGNAGAQGGLSGLNWFNQANALNGNRFALGINAGQAGCRTDQYLQPSNIAALLTSPSEWLVVGFPAVNDLAAAGGGCAILPGGAGTFPYTNSNGVVVTQTTVGQVAADNIINTIRPFLLLGKKIILTEEPGATNLSAASVTQQYDLNARLRAFASATPNVWIWSANSVLWNPTGSATLDTFVSGVLLDGVTHYSVLGGYLAGQVFNTFIQSIVPAGVDLNLAAINNINAANPRQLVNNPLFQTQTGGTNSGCTLSGGTVPSGWTVVCGVGTSSVTFSYVADPSGFGGSCVQIVMTTAGVDTIRFQDNAPTSTLYNLTDWFQSRVNVTIASGSTNMKVFMSNSLVSNVGNRQTWAVYGGDPVSGGGLNVGPTTAYTYQFVTVPAQFVAGSSAKSFINGPQIYHQFTAAGGATSTICRASFDRLYNYSATAGFTGQ